jgi:hypothetical protein
MSKQILAGAKITPKGTNNRFVAQRWGPSQAFGGFIWEIDTSFHYSDKPVEVKASLVLQTSSFSQSQAKFDIQPTDLHCDAGIGGFSNEILYDINLDGLVLQDFLLYEYNFSIEAGQKVLNVTFKDYSVILDKIYIGLFKKQGYTYPHYVSSLLELPIRCQDCEYQGGAYTGTGYALRDIGFSAYLGIGGNTYDLFANSYYTQISVFNEWQNNIINNQSQIAQFDLNGGYLILGTEAATEERCNSAPNINYSFIELLSALRKGGLIFTGSFPWGTGDSDYVYRNNHNGSLREVLQNWCSDLAYTFYTSGRAFVGINLQNPIDISGITLAADPTTSVGQYFRINDSGLAGGGNTTILDFESNVSLDNTFTQAVVVDNSYPITQKNISKTVKKFVGATPMHPISLNQIDMDNVGDINVYGTLFNRPKFEINSFDSNQFNPNNAESCYWTNFARLDGRSYVDVDAAIALTKYNPALRDIYVAQRALYNVGAYSQSVNGISPNFNPLTNAYCVANFTALGMFPIMEITGANFKTEIILDNFKNVEKDDISNLNIDQQYFRVFIGYYYGDLKKQIIEWESAAGEAMYKYGAITRGILTEFPYVPPNYLNDISPTVGFYGQQGLIYERLNNSFVPNTARYQDVKYTPFADVLLYSGYVSSNSPGVYYQNSNIYNPFIPPGYSDYVGRLPTGLWVATLDNDWGTLQTQFDQAMSFSLNDPCAESYPLSESIQQVQTSSDQSLQDWKIEYFVPPTPNPDLSNIQDIITSDEFAFSGVIDEIITTYTDLHYIKKQECKKLHVMIIPDTTIHPNVNIEFTPQPVNAINPVNLRAYKQKLYDAQFRMNTTETPSICSISMLDEMCRNIATGNHGVLNGQGDTIFQSQFVPPLTNQQTGCVIIEDKNNYMLEGFPSGVLFEPNSRTLDISITKNPNRQACPTLDENGDYYYSDLGLGSLVLDGANLNFSIVYPIQSFQKSIANYNVIYSSDIETEYRIPAYATVYGTPPNVTGNNTSTFKLVMNTVDSILDPVLDPLTTSVRSYITVLDGSGESIIKTPEQYYGYVKNLNNYSLLTPTKEVTMSLAGPPSQFGGFTGYLTPASGLQSISVSVTDKGVKTDLVFADRPKVLPKQESILNKIGPRIKGTYN